MSLTATPTEMTALTPTPAVSSDLAVRKSVNPQTAAVGATVTYTIIVTNIGSGVATGVVVEDVMPGFLALVSATSDRGETSVNGNTVRVRIGEMAPGETVTVTIRARVTALPRSPDNVNSASVSGDGADIDQSNNRSSVGLNETTPARLPATSDAGSGLGPVLVAALGVVLIVGSLLMRRREGRE